MEKNTLHLRVFSGVLHIPYKILTSLHFSWRDEFPMSPKRILKVDLNCILFAQVYRMFFMDVRKEKPVSNFRLNSFLNGGA